MQSIQVNMEADTLANFGEGPILVPIGINEPDIEPLVQGAKLADQYVRELIVLHAVHEPPDKPGIYKRLEPSNRPFPHDVLARRISERQLETAQQKYPSLLSLKAANLLLVNGLPAQRIVEVAKIENAAVIVIRGSNRKGLNRLLHSSISESVNKESPCLVINAG